MKNKSIWLIFIRTSGISTCCKVSKRRGGYEKWNNIVKEQNITKTKIKISKNMICKKHTYPITMDSREINVEVLQLRAKFQTAMVSCLRFVWITISSDHRRVWSANLLHMQETHSSNPPVVTGNCDLNKSRAQHHRRKRNQLTLEHSQTLQENNF